MFPFGSDIDAAEDSIDCLRTSQENMLSSGRDINAVENSSWSSELIIDKYNKYVL
jgi:hypothetical protein